VKKKENKEREINLLALIPVRCVDWEKNEEGLVILFKPKFKSAILKKHVLPHLKRPFYRVRLDTVGSFIWESLNGKNTVQEIAKLMKDKFVEKVNPLYDRLSVFLQHLEKNHFIEYKGL